MLSSLQGADLPGEPGGPDADKEVPDVCQGAAFSTGHIPHGCANAIYLPYVIKYNAKDKVAASRYAEIARRMGLPGTSEKALINSLCAKIDEFNAKMNIPKTLKEFGINEEEFKEKLDKIAELAVGDACTGSNPRAIDPEIGRAHV